MHLFWWWGGGEGRGVSVQGPGFDIGCTMFYCHIYSNFFYYFRFLEFINAGSSYNPLGLAGQTIIKLLVCLNN